ncbi:hypothetical protein [Paraburkholderia caribensis]|jgi:hypothetical protein|nr:hypothetical protein [Paraburkholderia caribensis]
MSRTLRQTLGLLIFVVGALRLAADIVRYAPGVGSLRTRTLKPLE